VAVDLGLDDPNGPATVLAQTIEHLGKSLADDTNVVYLYLLTACEKFFDNELDQGTFEEHMRWFFGTKVRVYLLAEPFLFILVYFRLTHYSHWTN
jgi:paired amphipathic helix protein Sin3a